MRSLARASAALLLAALAAASARAQSAAGADAFDFLRLDANARAVGLGGAYTALATDSNALLYNPAGLGRVSASEATFMHNQYAQGVTQQYIAAALKNGWGAQFNYASLGDVPRTTISNPGGTGGRLNVSDSSLGVGYGRELTSELSAGAGLKYVSESLGDATANGYAVDGGVLYRMPEVRNLTLGASLLNVGPAVKFASRSEKLPTTIRLGSAYALSLPRNDVTVAMDLSRSLSDKIRLGLGAETLIDRQFAARLGFTTRNDAGLGISLGLGWRGPRLGADYAFVPMGELGTAHRISFTLRWGRSTIPPARRSPRPARRRPTSPRPRRRSAAATTTRPRRACGAAWRCCPPATAGACASRSGAARSSSCARTSAGPSRPTPRASIRRTPTATPTRASPTPTSASGCASRRGRTTPRRSWPSGRAWRSGRRRKRSSSPTRSSRRSRTSRSSRERRGYLPPPSSFHHW
ncbi:MAG: PorV/PorQ family protein [Elusimicrobiota bacterium]|nr:MAG: PorV/PorQ family protein [Elusimicrobiota bacterium]